MYMFDYQDDPLVMFHCRRCGWTVCCDSEDGWLVDAARGRVLEHVQGHGVLSESESGPWDNYAPIVAESVGHPRLAGVGLSDESIMEGIERLLRQARGETK